MKLYKRLPALVLAILMVLCLTACTDGSNTDDSQDVTDANVTAAPSESEGAELDRTLPAIELGSHITTVGDIQDAYDYFMSYMSYYGMSTPTEDSEIAEYVNMVLEQALSSMVLPWKAEELGMALTAEDDDAIDEEVEENRTLIIADYEEYAREQLGEDATDEEVNTYALETIESDVQSYYGMSFEEYMVSYRQELESDKLTEKLEEYFYSTVALADGEAEEWFNQQLSTQQTALAEDPFYYRTTQEAYEKEESLIPAFTAPEGFTRVQVIRLALSEEEQTTYDSNLNAMATLEAEYGKLLLTNENPDRQAEIETEYASLKAANEELMNSLKTKGENALNEVAGGKDFGLVMEGYSSDVPTGSEMAFGKLLYTLSEDSNFETAIWNQAVAMTSGEVSGLIENGGVYYILKRGDDIVAGDRTFADFQEACEAAALSEKQDSEWSTAQDSWYTEAQNAAIYHEDNYALVGHTEG